VPVSNKTRGRGDGDPDEQDDHQDKGGRNGQLKTKARNKRYMARTSISQIRIESPMTEARSAGLTMIRKP